MLRSLAAALLLALAAPAASAHGLVAVGVEEDTDAEAVAVSVWGDATGAVAITVFGDADGETLTWSVCGAEPCADATASGPSPNGLFFVRLGAPQSRNAVVASDGDAYGDNVAISLFGRADCASDCSTTHADDPVATLAVSGTGCADGAVAVTTSDCADGMVSVGRDGLDDMDGDEFVLGFVATLLP